MGMPDPKSQSDVGDASCPTIDSFTIADHADAVNGKLYVMGGGITNLFMPAVPHTPRIAIASILRIPWGDTNRKFPLRAWAEDSDGNELGWRMEGQIEAGRPAGGRGEDVLVCFAVPIAPLEIKNDMRLRIVFQFANEERRATLLATRIQLPPQMQMPVP
jgi:Family of unknown function (DUF6941)